MWNVNCTGVKYKFQNFQKQKKKNSKKSPISIIVDRRNTFGERRSSKKKFCTKIHLSRKWLSTIL